MDGTQILTLGLGLEAPWVLKDQHLDTAVSPTAPELECFDLVQTYCPEAEGMEGRI